MATRIKLRSDIAANWAAANPILAAGEIGLVIEGALRRAKVGDGATAWNALDWAFENEAGGGATAFADLTDRASADLPAINGPLSAALAGKAAASHSHPASAISDSTGTGRAVLTAATQSDARTTGLGSGATGDALFTAVTPAAARGTLGVLSATATGTTAATGVTTDVVSIAIPAAGFWRVDALSTFTNAVGSSTLMSLLFDSALVIPASNFRIGQAQVVTTLTALTVASSASRIANIGATNATASSEINATAFGLIRTTGASVVTLRISNTAGTGTSTLTQGALIATQL
jgi:hypothetical protein